MAGRFKMAAGFEKVVFAVGMVVLWGYLYRQIRKEEDKDEK